MCGVLGVFGGLAQIIQNVKIKDLQPSILYLAKLSFRFEGQIKSFPEKNKLKEFISTKTVLQEMLERLFLRKKNVSKTGIKNGNNYIPTNKYCKWKRVKCSN